MMKPFAVALALLTAMSVEAGAHSVTKGDILVSHPWTRATPSGATVGAGSVKITNNSSESETLLGGSFDGAERVEVHDMKMDGDVMRMRKLDQGLEIPPGTTVELKPGAPHLMFFGLKKPIEQGHDVDGSLTFKHAGKVDIIFRVEPIGALSSSDPSSD